jgi:UDP-N-acetylglucosamine transferase subunit ALG13
MILVTVGTHNRGFERLVRVADEFAMQVEEEVIIQYGSSSYIPRYAKNFQWTSSEHMEQLTLGARVVVTHAAAGAIILAVRFGKPIVVVPRMRRFGEHIDDHQQQLAVALCDHDRVISVRDLSTESLKFAIQGCADLKLTHSSNQTIIDALIMQLKHWNITNESLFGGKTRKT